MGTVGFGPVAVFLLRGPQMAALKVGFGPGPKLAFLDKGVPAFQSRFPHTLLAKPFRNPRLLRTALNIMPRGVRGWGLGVGAGLSAPFKGTVAYVLRTSFFRSHQLSTRKFGHPNGLP